MPLHLHPKLSPVPGSQSHWLPGPLFSSSSHLITFTSPPSKVTSPSSKVTTGSWRSCCLPGPLFSSPSHHPSPSLRSRGRGGRSRMCSSGSGPSSLSLVWAPRAVSRRRFVGQRSSEKRISPASGPLQLCISCPPAYLSVVMSFVRIWISVPHFCTSCQFFVFATCSNFNNQSLHMFIMYNVFLYLRLFEVAFQFLIILMLCTYYYCICAPIISCVYGL